ncbi:MAG: FAD-dependent oxidoreductase [Ktedonobacteraceae bacterium]
MAHQPQIIIVGAGIVGLSTAYTLLERGMHNVLVLEQAAVNHPRSTSASISRLLRFEYGTDAFYSRMVKLSLEHWKELERKTQCHLYTPTGLLTLGKAGEEIRREHEITRSLGLPSELLTPQSCRKRFPQFEIKGYETLAYNATGGILHASKCLNTLKRAILARGGKIVETSKVTHVAHENPGRSIHIRLNTGEKLHADRVVIAIGPWVHRLLSQLHIPVTMTRQYLLYFAGLTPTHFGSGVFPAFIERDLYGFPIHQGSRGLLKVSSHQFGHPVDPDAAIAIEPAVIARTVRDARALLPDLHKATLTNIDACIYDVSPDEDFILDHVPGDERIVFATGLSGHGFKFGPLLGQLLSSMICDTQPAVPLTRFRLARFAAQSVRQPISVA